MKDQRLPTIDDLIAEIAGIPIEELAQEPTADGQHLISVDELRAAGALDVPAVWRKSLAPESRYTLPGFGDDDDDTELDAQVDDESAESTDEYARTDQPHESTSYPPHQPKPESASHARQSRAKK